MNVDGGWAPDAHIGSTNFTSIYFNDATLGAGWGLLMCFYNSEKWQTQIAFAPNGTYRRARIDTASFGSWTKVG